MKRIKYKANAIVLLWALLFSVPSVWAEIGLLAGQSIAFFSPCTPSSGHVIARKYHDQNDNAVRDGGEEWLAGFQFRLERGGSQTGPWTLVSTKTTTSPNGQADFSNQPSGWYRITEELTPAQVNAGWTNTTPLPMVFYHTGEHNSEKKIGNLKVSLGVLKVTKTVNWSGLCPNQGQNFTICITGPSFPQGDCKTIGYDGGELVWDELIPGEYTVTENDPGCQWTVEIIGSPANVIGCEDTGELVESAGLVECDPQDPPDDECEPAEVIVINTHRLGGLKVNKAVDWNGVPVNPNQVFEICLTGPSYPQGDCQEVDYDGGELIWSDLIPGCYTISESDPGCQWDVCIPSSQVVVVPCGPPAELAVLNTHKLGCLSIDKIVDWNDVEPDQCVTFEICITGPSYPNGDCQTIDYDGGELTWSDLIPGCYTISESDPGSDWKVLIDPNPVEVGACEPAGATVTNIRHAPPGTIIIKKIITEDCMPLCCDEIFFDFQGDIGGVVSQGKEMVFADLPHGLYSTTEIAPGDWMVESITVDDDNSTFSIEPDGKTGTVLFQLEPGEVITAVFTNRKPTVVLDISSSVGGQVTYPGEGIFEYCLDTLICMEVELTNPLFTFLGWRGTLFMNANAGAFDPNIPMVDICGDPIDLGDVDPIAMKGCTALTMDQDHALRAVFQSKLDILYVDDDAPNDLGPYDLLVGDPYESGTADHPFDSVQEAIEVAKPGATVVVLPGTYRESLALLGKVLTITSTDPDSNEPVLDYPVIEAIEGEPVVTFDFCSDPNMVLEGLVLTGGNDNDATGVRCRNSDVVIKNCLIVGNRRLGSGGAGGGALWCSRSQAALVNCTLSQNYGGINGAGVYANTDSHVTVLDSILWDNLPGEVLTDVSSVVTIVTSDISGGYVGAGNLDADPAFVTPGYWEHALNPGMVVLPSHSYAVWVAGDYHLTEGSACVDSGNALSDYSQEPEPNGGRINLGAYGNTPQATLTPIP